MTRVLIVDDHPTFRAGLRAVLSAAGIDVVAEAADGDAAVSAVEVHAPTVVLMDLAMPGTAGVEATRLILRQFPGTAVPVLSMSGASEAVQAALRAGARGYLLKDAAPADIVAGVRAVAAGQAVFGAGLAELVLDQVGRRPAAGPFPSLSERERQVLELLARGDDNAAIGRTLGISPKTARNYVSVVLTKLGVPDRGRAIVLARDAGLGRDPR